MNISSKENFAVMYTKNSYIAGWFNPPSESLSRMSRKVQVRFLGDKGGVIRLRYPTKPTAQMAHLVFSYTQANAQKTKRAIFLQTHGRTNRIKKVTL
jgi:hypothetical protein